MARAARGALAWLVTSAALVTACNAISGLDADYQLGDGTPQGEAGVDGGDRDVQADAPVDGGPGDTGSPGEDAQIDGGGLDCSPPVVPAGGAALFCDNFDDPGKMGPDFGWNRNQKTSGEPKVEPNVGYVGGGMRASVTTTAVPPGEGWVTALWKTVQTGLPDGQRLTLRLRFKVNAANIDYAVIGAVQLNSFEYGIAMYRGATCPGGDVCIDENDHQGGHDFTGALPLVTGQWYLAEITVTRSGNGFGGKTVLVGAGTLDDRPLGVLPAGNPGNIEVGVGAFFGSNNSSADVIVDDVLVWRH